MVSGGLPSGPKKRAWVPTKSRTPKQRKRKEGPIPPPPLAPPKVSSLRERGPTLLPRRAKRRRRPFPPGLFPRLVKRPGRGRRWEERSKPQHLVMARLFKCLQANVQHSKAGSYLLGKRILDERIDIALIQEPWVTSRGRINGLSNLPGKVISLGSGESPRSCIFVRNTIDIFVLTGFCSRDVTSILVKLPMETGTKELVICSAYFPGDTMFPPPNEVRKLVAFCRGKNLQLLVACDANSHHTTWGSTDINERGHCRLRAHLKKLKIVNDPLS
ncbi:uncharacterized protein LOC123318380 [Coccinella septempunctata]|uniref:uncharacterized protein LOC123318380 n=1 Tax=Coccinella septempunctata TaxID=41139 RepID=UPI001D06F73C|nr:uncharacterized protein LOC123318380 [Coccinella septempunctata]